jgi:hypothetical protein
VLNTLRNKGGSVSRDYLIKRAAENWAFTRAQVLAADWNVIEEERDGDIYWVLPKCLIAIWWHRKITAPGNRVAERVQA